MTNKTPKCQWLKTIQMCYFWFTSSPALEYMCVGQGDSVPCSHSGTQADGDLTIFSKWLPRSLRAWTSSQQIREKNGSSPPEPGSLREPRPERRGTLCIHQLTSSLRIRKVSKCVSLLEDGENSCSSHLVALNCLREKLG